MRIVEIWLFECWLGAQKVPFTDGSAYHQERFKYWNIRSGREPDRIVRGSEGEFGAQFYTTTATIGGCDFAKVRRRNISAGISKLRCVGYAECLCS